MRHRRPLGRWFWCAATICALILLVMCISARFGFGVAFVGGSATVGNGQVMIWRYDQPTFWPDQAYGYRGRVFEHDQPTLMVVPKALAIQSGRVRDPGLDWDLFGRVTPLVSLSGPSGPTVPVRQPIGLFMGLWMWAVLCAIPMIRPAIRRYRDYSRRRRGLCLSCGHNLTANVSGCYPECGTATLT